MLNFVPDHLKTKNICKSAVKKLPFIKMFVPDWYKTSEMSDKISLENGEILRFIPYYCKNKKNV